jgi:hypothetical protein
MDVMFFEMDALCKEKSGSQHETITKDRRVKGHSMRR